MAKDKATITVKMTKGRETPGTHVYKDATDGTAIPSLYIKKSALPDAPETITVTVVAG